MANLRRSGVFNLGALGGDGASSTRPTRKWGGMLGRSLTTDVDAAPVVDHSLRFDGSADYLNRVVTASDRTTWTWSAWVKKSDLGVRDYLFSGGAAGDASNLFYLYWESNTTASRNNQLYVIWREASDYAISAATRNLETSASYNDTSAWYHVVLSVDTTKSNSSDRMKIYIDGAEVSYANDNRNSIVSSGLSVNAAGNLCMGAYAYSLTSTTSRFKGQMAEIHFVDGQALTAADFGEINANSQWMPKEVTGMTYGTNGFYLPLSTPSSTTNAFNAVTFTGDGTIPSRTVSGVGFQADMIWLKNRDTAYSHQIVDTVRGATMALLTNSTLGEGDTQASFIGGGVETITADGFTIGDGTQSNNNLNASGDKIVGWTWKAGGAPTAINSGGQTPTSGSVMIDGVASTAQLPSAPTNQTIIYPTKMSVNTEAGFSIVEWSGTENDNGGNEAIPHGLNSAPELIVFKSTITGNWIVGSDYLGNTAGWNKQLYLNLPNSVATSSASFNDTAPTSSTFTVGASDATNDKPLSAGAASMIAYCWHSVPGFSKFGSYTGSNGAGNKVTTGFKPAFVMIKSTGSNNWVMIDNKRSPVNHADEILYADDTAIEVMGGTTTSVNFLADGFDFGGAGGSINAGSTTYIYMAFADTSPNLGRDASTDGKGVTLLLDGSSTTNDVANSQVFETDTNVTAQSAGVANSNGPVLDFGSGGNTPTTGHMLDNDPTSLPEGTEDFTVEFWFRQDYVTNSVSRSLFVGLNGIAQRQVDIFLDAANKVNYYHTSSTKIAGTTTIGYQQWHHIAAVRKDGTTTLYVDGVSQGSFSDTGSYTAGTRLALGAFYDGTSWATGGNSLQGQMADVRVTRGIARDIASGFSSGTPISGGGWDVSLTNDNTWSGKAQNNFTVNGNITPDDQLIDSPNLRFASFDPAFSTSVARTLSEGNLWLTSDLSNFSPTGSTQPMSSGKYYAEFLAGDSNRRGCVGVCEATYAFSGTNRAYQGSDNNVVMRDYDGHIYANLSAVSSNTVTITHNSTVIGVALDLDSTTKTVKWYLDGALHYTYTLASPPSMRFSAGDISSSFTAIVKANFGQDHTFAGTKSPLTSPHTDADGNGEFYYQPPTGFKALTTKIVGSDTVLQSTGVISLAEHYQTKL